MESSPRSSLASWNSIELLSLIYAIRPHKNPKGQVSRCWSERISSHSFPTGMPAFGRADLQHCLVVGPLQVLQLALVPLAHVLCLARRVFSNPPLPFSTQPSISGGVRSNWRLAAATIVLPWLISRTSADLRPATQRLITSSIPSPIGVSFVESNTCAENQWIIKKAKEN